MSLTESIAIGLIFGFFLYEWVGFSPGGFIVPGYVGLYWDRPLMIISTLVVSLFAYGLVHFLARITILYGRRRFIVTILVGFAFRWLFDFIVSQTSVVNTEIHTIGYIIPGLIANDMERQKILPTLFLLIIVSVLVRLTLLVLAFWRT